MPTYIQGLHHGANILLAHFHCCNKGSYPFSLKHNFPASIAELNEDQISFVARTARYFEARSKFELLPNASHPFTNNRLTLSRGNFTQSKGRWKFP
jgi:hypothetical protein